MRTDSSVVLLFPDRNPELELAPWQRDNLLVRGTIQSIVRWMVALTLCFVAVVGIMIALAFGLLIAAVVALIGAITYGFISTADYDLAAIMCCGLVVLVMLPYGILREHRCVVVSSSTVFVELILGCTWVVHDPLWTFLQQEPEVGLFGILISGYLLLQFSRRNDQTDDMMGSSQEDDLTGETLLRLN